MLWDVERHRGAGFVLYPLHLLGAFPVLSHLTENSSLHRVDLAQRLAEDHDRHSSLICLPHVGGGIRKLLTDLRTAGLVKQAGVEYPSGTMLLESTELGAGLVGAVMPVTGWSLRWMPELVLSARLRLGMSPPMVPIQPRWRRPRLATELAVGLLAHRWALTVLVYVDGAECDGIGPADLQARVNADLEASAGASRVEWRLSTQSAYEELRRLVAGGLIVRRVLSEGVPPSRVQYRLTPMGKDLMGALWEVSRWGMKHDAELFQMVAKISGWFPDATTD